MRPVQRGQSPQAADYDDYREAFPHLLSRLGQYCSYCERRIPSNLAVEHIQPKGLPQHAHLSGRWDNFLLACVNCNSTKGDQDVVLADCLLPDRDNTAYAYEYTADGKVAPSPSLTVAQARMASATLALCGLDRRINEVMDENGKLVALDRVAQRMEAWGIALSSRDDLAAHPTDPMRRQIVRAAVGHGFFSIWLKVFAHDSAMRRMLIDGFTQNGQVCGFPGTARDCFDDKGRHVTPRPQPTNGLPHGGKV